ncbi:flagellar biosynthesis protein FlhF [Kurthia sibirica]|uniref:Flagellar biosynthesis protein FlhF n=1 Tax=Kurthia sibirica TaxID=202750 RepID=A0A2U3AQU4_9BACL|nr:flagellar biosynthesis protein FlhF [Kurthia sibirica]PWI26913.1 flagellar biosynthesis protein FlhF [Kurthia sibirica]GEK32545.1 flagellar biosynthesis protein FlhF [Kurthia sibirica]
MKMKKYIANTMPEAMAFIRKDFGDDSIIISSKVVYSRGFLGMFKKKQFEVVVGIEQQETADTRPDIKSSAVVMPKMMNDTPDYTQQNAEIKKQLDELRSIMKSVNTQQQQLRAIPSEMQAIVTLMKKQELNEELIAEICDELFVIMQNNTECTESTLMIAAQEALFRKLSKLPMGGITFEQKFVNVLGPTGVGKTTTIAKMAARAVLEKKKKVAFITTDTYRIGAIEQLKTYANLLQAPVEVVYTSEDYKRAIQQFSGHDLVLIDTAGRNYKETKFVEDLEQLIDVKSNVQNFLVLSLTAKEQDMAAIIEQFSTFTIEQFVFTKMDETNTIGSMINLMVKYNKGLAYYTDGQEVPENIAEGSVAQLVELFFRGAE